MKRITLYISDEQLIVIKEMAEKDNRSVNKTIDLLLQQAIKEKTRKRKNVKENNT